MSIIIQAGEAPQTEHFTCFLCGQRQNWTNGIVGPLDNRGQQRFACLVHLNESRSLAIAMADFMLVEEFELLSAEFNDEYGQRVTDEFGIY